MRSLNFNAFQPASRHFGESVFQFAEFFDYMAGPCNLSKASRLKQKGGRMGENRMGSSQSDVLLEVNSFDRYLVSTNPEAKDTK